MSVAFPDSVATDLLASSRRHCCVCLRWRGRGLEIHHIVPVTSGGNGDRDNGIPVCFDCHAEIESKSNMGRKFTSDELRRYRDEWFAIVRNHPEKLIAASIAFTESGPLEALLGEMFYNYSAVAAASFPPLEVHQFRRAIALNALAIVPEDVRDAVNEAYRAIGRVNHDLERLMHLRPASADYKLIEKPMQSVRVRLHTELLTAAIVKLENTLGKTVA
jgi:hypothetical protein